MNCCKTAAPRGAMLIPLREMFPEVCDDDMCILTAVGCNGGSANAGDVVSCLINGEVQLGQLQVAAGVKHPSNGYSSFCIVSLVHPDPNDIDCTWRKFLVSRENVVMVPLKCMDTVFTYRMALDHKSCSVFLPFELRPK